MMNRALVTILLFSAAGFGCSPAATPVDTTADQAAIAALSDREIAFFSSGSVDSSISILTPDAVLMPPNEPMQVGVDAIRAWATALLNQFTASGRYTDRAITVAGDWAIERYVGELSVTPKAGGPTTTEKIKGIHVYQRQADGSWRIAQDAWSADTPPAPVPPPAK